MDPNSEEEEEEGQEVSSYWAHQSRSRPMDIDNQDSGYREIEHDEDDTGNERDTPPAQPLLLNPEIKAIDRSVVHQICSGQVIVTLSTAVKELVENALDAGSTSVEIQMIDYGAASIQVLDNGSGVEETDFNGLALKHHTSKIHEFEDLGSLSTFGFRGEALSSLCALTECLTVMTRHKSSKTGWKLDYDQAGNLIGKCPFAREVGTTVVLTKLFATLPVRHREFLKHGKKEFHKMVNVLNAYCIISKGVRITCTHKIGNAPYSTVISIPSTSQTLRDRIVGIFGSKQMLSLLEIEQEEILDEEMLQEFGLTGKTFVSDKFRLEGFVSKPNEGRSGNDRQFFYVNNRPCDMPKLSKIINEVYHGFSRNQSPFVVLNVKTMREGVDVNVTPDKRQLYIQSEKSLYALVKASLVSLYKVECSSSSTSNQSSIREFYSSIESTKDRGGGGGGIGSENNNLFAPQYSTSLGKGNKYKKAYSQQTVKSSSSTGNLHMSSLRSQFSKTPLNTLGVSSFSLSQPCSSSSKDLGAHLLHSDAKSPAKKRKIEAPSSLGSCFLPEEVSRKDFVPTGSTKAVEVVDWNEDENVTNKQDDSCKDSEPDQCSPHFRIIYDDELFPDLNQFLESRQTVNINIDWQLLKTRLKTTGSNPETNYAQKFHAKISPGENDVAELELRKQLRQDMFSRMEIIGQFNHGFIIVKLDSDLFIVDQHASDEKWNFENLQKTTVLQTQNLLIPLELELPAISETIVMDNLETFRNNGFDFSINVQAEATKRVKLSKIPYSRTCEFGKSDIEEMVFMLEDYGGGPEVGYCRPSKIRGMLASRSCRKSVMIGTPLSNGDMRRIVDHMGDMDQPWNCPHGRPTIRFLFNTKLLPNH